VCASADILEHKPGIMASYAYSNWGGVTQAAAQRDNGTMSGPRAKCDQVIYEAMCKACEIVVCSRGNSTTAQQQQQHYPNTPASSSRFNLNISEIPGVRSILQTYRHSLHVPIRLDVYYQHEGGRRELLERWCLEYQPAPSERFLQAEGIVTQDPIVQLRHVCKRIVLWLRTLYCWTRLLPAQAFSNSSSSSSGKPPIGFSIYVNSAGKDDDVLELTQNQGFRWQAQPSPVVSPYGELKWKVVYSPAVSVERLLPARMTSTLSRPIPQRQQQRQPQKQMDPQSAPALFMRQPQGFAARSQPSRGRIIGPQAATQPQQQQNTYHVPSRLLDHRSQSVRDEEFPGHDQKDQSASPKLPTGSPVLRRRHTSIGQELGEAKDAPPGRVMSGLSLALMMQRDDSSEHANDDSLFVSTEKRHAALHELPPHLTAAAPATRTNNHSTTEYGYAYNSHIPWQRIHPSTNPPVFGRPMSSDDRNFLTASPANALASTPPSAAFLGATTGMTPPTGPFLMPRTLAQPPFEPRPAGFVQQQQEAAAHMTQQQPTVQQQPVKNSANVASLDLLHSSPFQQQQQQQQYLQQQSSNGSLICSLSHSAFVQGGSDLRRSLWSAPGSPSPGDHDNEDFCEEMPFAVDLSGSAANATTNASSASSLYNSSVVASFAQKCAPLHHRLRLFDSNTMNKSIMASTELVTSESARDDDDDDPVVMSSLVDQLADFRSFGASLQHPQEGSSDSTASVSTPISLRS
jgi:hypothetical protein